MKNNIKVSIIVPVYNTAKYLKKCLDSLINQTLRDIEIICVNDGSTDDSLDVLNNYKNKDPRIKIITQKNQGQSVARNNGINFVEGEFIGFVDSDDFIDETMFEKLYNNASYHSSDISMCSFNVLNEKTGDICSSDPYLTLDLFPKDFEDKAFNCSEVSKFLFRICVSPCNKIYKSKFLLDKDIRFPNGLYFEDNVFFYESFMQAKSISLIKEQLYYYRMASHTSTVSGDDIKKLDFFEIFEKIESFLKSKNFYDELKDYFYTHKKNTLIYWYRKLKNQKVKEEYYQRLNAYYDDIELSLLTGDR